MHQWVNRFICIYVAVFHISIILSSADDLTRLVSESSMTNGVDERSGGVDLIEMDEASMDIFGEDGLAELNDALRQLSNIKAGHIAPTKGMCSL